MAAHEARSIATYILAKTDREGGVTPLKLQKLLYYVQAWSLALDGRPIFGDPIEAWDHGPVVADVYHLYRAYGWREIDPPAPAEVPELDDRARSRIERVLVVYGELTGTQLERMSHGEEPWRAARRDRAAASGPPVIEHAAMARYYRSLVASSGE